MTTDKENIEWALAQGESQPPNSETQIEGLPKIHVSGRHMRHITDDAIKVLGDANAADPFLFRRGNSLVRLSRDQKMVAEALTLASLRGILDRSANFIKTNEKGIESPARPVNDVIQDILSLPELPFPALQGFHSAPVFMRGGELLNRTGYNEETGLFLYLDGLSGISGGMSLPEAKDLILYELLGDFPFSDQGSVAHILALMLQPYVRLLIDGPTPLYLIDAPSRGSGKGLIADVIAYITLGEPAAIMVLTRDEDELEKRITATLVEGHPMIVLDNVTSLRSSTLSAVLTTMNWRGRWLGKSKMVHAPNTATWICTGNNVTLSDEMVRRVTNIRLDAKMARPEERTGFRHPDLMGWVQSNRMLLVQACLSIVQAWVDAGMPLYSGPFRLGRFEQWVDVIGGILNVAGVDGFGSNRETMYAISDSDTTEWTLLCEAWHSQYGESPITAKDLLALAKDKGLVMDRWAGRVATAGQQRMGHALLQRRDKLFGDYFIRHAGTDGSTRSNAYRLEINKVAHKTHETTETTGNVPESGSKTSGVLDGQNVKTPETPVDETPELGTNPGVSGVSVVLGAPSFKCTCDPIQSASAGGPTCSECHKELWCRECSGCRYCRPRDGRT